MLNLSLEHCGDSEELGAARQMSRYVRFISPDFPGRWHQRTVPPGPAPKTLYGVLERLTFQNEETGYTVARLLPDRKPPSGESGSPTPTSARQGSMEERLVTIVGPLLGVVAGEALELTGFWQRPKEH